MSTWLALWALASHAATPLEDALWLDRLSFGATQDSLAQVRRLGREAWLAQQLQPSAKGELPAAVQARIDALRISREPVRQIYDELLEQRERLQEADSAASSRQERRSMRRSVTALRDEAVQRALLRALYSPRQLHELMSWFWFNHFNVAFEGQPGLSALVGDYEERAIRPFALGRFSDLLRAVATHPMMLMYLNNDRNVVGRINENYARELMELHTLGVDGGYTQQDVQQLAQVLTGLGVRRHGQRDVVGLQAFSDGMALFNPRRHATGERQLLGKTLNGEGWRQIEQALDLLAHHPATARHISRKLAQYFVSDAPPEALVARLAQRFISTDGDIAAVLTALVASPEFSAALDRKFKDPVHYVLSAVRLSLPPGQMVEPVQVQLWLALMGQQVYGRRTPDGYPLTADAWNGSGQMTQRFEIARQIATGAHLDPAGRAALVANAPATARPDLSPDSTFAREVLWPGLSARGRQVLQQAQSALVDWRTLLLASPEFMTR